MLGPALGAVIAGATAEDVASWANNETAPEAAKRQLLLDAVEIVDELLKVDDADVVRAWCMGMNPQLDDKAPAEILAEGPVS